MKIQSIGPRPAWYRYGFLVLLILSLAAMIITGLNRRQHSHQLRRTLVADQQQTQRLFLCTQSITALYEADAALRNFLLTRRVADLDAYKIQVARLKAGLQQLQALPHAENTLLRYKTNLAASLLRINVRIDSLLGHTQVFQNIAGLQLPQPRPTRTITQTTVTEERDTTKRSRKKLLGRIADAIKGKEDSGAGTRVIVREKWAHATNSSHDTVPQQDRVLFELARYRAQMKQQEYDLAVANVKLIALLKADLQDLVALQQEALETQALQTRRSTVSLLQKLDKSAGITAGIVLLLTIMILLSIAQLYRNEKRLKAAHLQAAGFAQAKSSLLSHVSHEIRSPLNSIIGYTHLLQEENHLPPQTEKLSAIHQASGLLLELVNNILDLSKLEAGKMTTQQNDFDPVQVMRSIHATLQVQAQNKQLKLLADVPPSSIRLTGDAVRLKQILLNLTTNAIKYTCLGQVTLRLQLQPQSGNSTLLTIQVQDTGDGIDEKLLPVLFDEFIPTGAAGEDQVRSSTGLGLSITHKLVTLLQGSITVKSEKGKGSVFTVSIPFPNAESQVAAPAPAPIQISKPVVSSIIVPGKALIVDDNEINSALTSLMLHKYNIPSGVARNGVEALQMLGNHAFDILLTDIQMPRMDGLSLIEEVRKKHPGIQIIVVSGYDEETLQRMLNPLQISQYLIKPFTQEDLRKQLCHSFPKAGYC